MDELDPNHLELIKKALRRNWRDFANSFQGTKFEIE